MQLHIQNFEINRDTRETKWVVETHAVETETDERGITFLLADGVRFGLLYGDGTGRACTLQNPYTLPAGRAQQIARRMWTSCIGLGAPSKEARWVTE